MIITSYDTAKGKKWRVRYRKPSGQQTDKRGFLRRKDAELWAAEHVTTAKATGSYIDPQSGKITVGQLYEQWFEQHEPLWKPSYAKTVQSRWRSHIASQWEYVRVMDVTKNSLQTWSSSIARTKSASLTRTCADIMRQILEKAVEDNRIPVNPMMGVVLPKRAKRRAERRYLTISQLVAFADECLHATIMPVERRAIILVLGFCGLRWGEMCALTVQDIDLARRRINVKSNITKAGNTWVEGTPKNGLTRSVPMPQIVVDAILPILDGKERTERVFTDPSGEPPRYQSVSDKADNKSWYVSALRRAGLPAVSPHDLRHTSASIAVHAGANVKALQMMLGHATASMTLDVYADLFDSDLDDVARIIDSTVQIERQNFCGQNVGKNSMNALIESR